MSASRNAAIAKPRRIVIPDEYVRTGRSIACSSSANATISSKRSRMSAAAKPLNRSVQIDVLAAAEVGVEPGSELEQRADPSLRADAAGGGLDDARDDPEQRRLAGAVTADQADCVSPEHVEVDVLERPDVGGLAPPTLNEEILEGSSLARVDAETARDAFDADLASFHVPT